MAGVNKSFARCFIIFIVTCILLEGIVFLGLSLYGLTLKPCLNEKINSQEEDPFTKFQILMQLVYFNDNSNCNIKTALDNGYEIYFQSSVSPTSVTSRTFIFLLTYAAISSIWILLSVIALIGLCAPPTRKAQLVCFLPFLLAIIFGCVLDIVASVFFAIDISNTTSLDKAVNYLGISYKVMKDDVEITPPEFPDMKSFNSFMFIPSVIMICLSSRVVLLWILNLVGAAFVFTMSEQLIDPFHNKQEDIQHFPPERPEANPQVQRLNSRKEVPPPTPVKPIRQEPVNAVNEHHSSVEVQRVISYEPSEGIRRTETRILEPLKFIDQDENEEYRRSVSPVSIPVKNKISRQNSNQTKKEPYYTPQTSYKEQSPSVPLNIRQQLSSDSPLNYRYSSQDFNANIQGHNDEEKYGQLPWSYSKDLGDVLKARQQIMTSPNRNSEMPIIPVPDYTIHPNRKDRNSKLQVTNVNYGH